MVEPNPRRRHIAYSSPCCLEEVAQAEGLMKKAELKPKTVNRVKLWKMEPWDLPPIPVHWAGRLSRGSTTYASYPKQVLGRKIQLEYPVVIKQGRLEAACWEQEEEGEEEPGTRSCSWKVIGRASVPGKAPSKDVKYQAEMQGTRTL
ncbi:hypothetical protein Y1Q_0021541 [Alligator mississippiensis]|uniref:Uncharacterized protein n=1 Tax=Alligator mississippiensis TaxID=8496 RepID=A0A151PA57_ALLMI|nr:hypothetical protein Y1Q_0021541 [Alligator mississippiensis]